MSLQSSASQGLSATDTPTFAGATLTGPLVVSGSRVAPANGSQAAPANPTGTTSTTGVMMGLGGSITPTATVGSGNVLLMVSGDIFNATAIADGAKVQLRYGTGSAPLNGAALTGTVAGGLVVYIAPTTAAKAPFALQALAPGLTLGTAYWIDVSLAAVTGGTATIENLSVTAIEI